ncbi:MAG TPA: TonB-dependent receptor, partial [Flavobacteriia bacterium]|nr:TonB-dependent receptor [Flavobacteriia bacterium]
MKKIIFISFLWLSFSSFAQNKESFVKGRIFNINNKPISNVNITYKKKGTTSDDKGYFKLKLPSDKKIELVFNHINYQEKIYIIRLKRLEIKT